MRAPSSGVMACFPARKEPSSFETERSTFSEGERGDPTLMSAWLTASWPGWGSTESCARPRFQPLYWGNLLRFAAKLERIPARLRPAERKGSAGAPSGLAFCLCSSRCFSEFLSAAWLRTEARGALCSSGVACSLAFLRRALNF